LAQALGLLLSRSSSAIALIIMAPSLVILVALLSHQSKAAFGQDVNVYGKPMTACGGSHGAGCEYSSMDAGAHQVCVTSLPHGFSSDTGQGAWSDAYQGQPWCICIWAYSNYIVQGKGLPLKCDAIPAKVLEEQYSLDKFQQCGSMSSTEGCGAEDIRKSIQSLCTQCDNEAGNDQAAKAALNAKCAAILASAPAAAMGLYSDDLSKTQDISLSQRTSTLSSFTMATSGLAIAGLSVVVVLNLKSRVASVNQRSHQDASDNLEHQDVFE